LCASAAPKVVPGINTSSTRPCNYPSQNKAFENRLLLLPAWQNRAAWSNVAGLSGLPDYFYRRFEFSEVGISRADMSSTRQEPSRKWKSWKSWKS